MPDSERPAGDALIRAAAYGGTGWRPRRATHREEIGRQWRACGIDSEWRPLRAVLLHKPGPELAASAEPDMVQMLAPLDLARAQAQHEALAEAYRNAGVTVHALDPAETPPPNQMFMADLFFMTPEGAVLARPASAVRAGEERWVARRLADLGVPILRILRGGAVFEGADALWIDEGSVILGRGLRTNDEGVAQVSALLSDLDVRPVVVDLPHGTIHLMGILRFVDKDLAVAWPRRLATAGVEALRARGIEVVFLPDEDEARNNRALNLVCLGPRRILMPAGTPVTEAFYRSLGIDCVTVEVGELATAAGAIGCLTGVLRRDLA